MKKIIILTIAIITGMSSYAQRFVYVDSDYILNQIPEYQDAQDDLDEIAEKWQQEIDDQYQEIDRMFRAYQNEAPLLTEEMRKQREQEIVDKEKAAKKMQEEKFGYEGALFEKRKELIKPIQDKVYEAINKMASTRLYDVVFDKSAGVTMLYASTKYDKSDEILDMLGYK